LSFVSFVSGGGVTGEATTTTTEEEEEGASGGWRCRRVLWLQSPGQLGPGTIVFFFFLFFPFLSFFGRPEKKKG